LAWATKFLDVSRPAPVGSGSIGTFLNNAVIGSNLNPVLTKIDKPFRAQRGAVFVVAPDDNPCW
jgi:hypothetical protein